MGEAMGQKITTLSFYRGLGTTKNYEVSSFIEAMGEGASPLRLLKYQNIVYGCNVADVKKT